MVSDTTQEEKQEEQEREQGPQPEQQQLDPIVAHYDTDNSGAIEQDEWTKAKEDYADGKLTNAEIHAVSKARA